ncbi:MAG: dehydrogenase [Chitinophagales bacterium]|nr:dehydrogenase [Chitinophagales bacterium]HAE12840.1 dehydrogenase [Bacteroidota bacterium]MCB9019875.1 dehydrogenase [Chitinophagales bacterium]MCB9020642.1 dehydrogenase [Chitinophagales bacterium]MCB9032141.1 dehydrogenase [Chitinophagales bacterium]
MIIRSKAPLRIGLAGGGTDVSPYSDIYGGCILNVTINKYAYATIIPRKDDKIILHAMDREERIELQATSRLEIDGQLDLLKGVYNRVVRDYNHNAPLSFELNTYVDAPPGSGLGSSSTLVTAIVGAFTEWLKLPLGEYDMAHLAYDIERKDLAFAGGKQDQYAATFGGWNFMEFYKDDKVIVNPLRIRSQYQHELEFNMLMYYTGTSRLSSTIIEAQSSNVQKKSEKSIEAMHNLKEQAYMMKEAILKGDLNRIGDILDYGWNNKKQTASGVSSPVIDEIYEGARKAGATGGKISGAGGGGFMTFYCPGNTRYKVIEVLKSFGGEVHNLEFSKYGLTTWEAK